MIAPEATVKTVSQTESPMSVGNTSRVVRHHEWRNMETLRPQWDLILQSNPSLSIFSTPEWLGSWWNAYGEGKELVSFVLHDDGLVSCVVPMYREPLGRRLGRNSYRLRLVGDGSGDSDNLDLLIRPYHEPTVLAALFEWLVAEATWSVCCLDTLPDNSRTVEFLVDELSRRHWPFRITRVPRWHIPLPDTWERYLESLPPEFRPLLTRYPRRLETRYHSRYVRCASVSDLQKYLPALFELHQKRWELAGEPGSFSNENRKHFYEQMAEAFLGRGWLEFWILELEGSVAATQFCFQYNNSVYLLQEGFDPRFAKDKVGYALRSKMLQYFIQQRFQRYDFLGGTQPHKLRFGAVEGSYLNIHFAKPYTWGAAYVRYHHRAKQTRDWMKARLPRCIVSLIQQMSSSGQE